MNYARRLNFPRDFRIYGFDFANSKIAEAYKRNPRGKYSVQSFLDKYHRPPPEWILIKFIHLVWFNTVALKIYIILLNFKLICLENVAAE